LGNSSVATIPTLFDIGEKMENWKINANNKGECCYIAPGLELA